MELKIYNQTGDLKLTVSPNTSSTVTEEVMGECAVSVGFTHTEFVMLDVNDYIDIEGIRYRIMSQYRPKQKNTQTYEYSVKFYAPIHQAENTLMLFTPDNEMTSEFAYDGGPREHLQLWIDNMNRIAGTDVWKIGTVITAENKVIEYKNVKCWDAAFGSNGIAAAFNTEMWADGYYINLCKAERGERVDLGYLQGLTSLQQEENGEVKFFTRLFPLGSTRNIDASKYGHARLQLPDGVQFVDKNVDIYGVKEEFEEEAFSEIYPKYIGTVQSVRTENLTNTEGRDYTVYYIKDAAIPFNPNDYEIAEQVKMIAFQTGELAGRGDDKGSFQANWHEDTKEWEIINTYPDEETQIPGGLVVPKAGDTYIPWNFRMPDSYIEAAEQEFLEAVNDYLDEYSFDTNKYSGQTDRNHIQNNNIKLMIGLNVRLLSDTYFIGGTKDTRITKVVRQLNDLYQATVTCTDKIGQGWKASVDNSIGSLKYELAKKVEQTVIDIIKTGESKTASDYNVFSALRSLSMFLRKDQPDITNHLLKLLGGIITTDIKTENLVLGALGTGYCLLKKNQNGNSYGEIDELFVRKKAIFSVLEILELQYSGGNYIFSPAGARCSKVEEFDTYYRCYFTADDGTKKVKNKFRVDDQVQCREFNIEEGVHENVSNKYYWRLCVGVGDDYIDLSKSVRDMASDDPPAEGDSMVTVGNQKDVSRQNVIIISVYGEGSPSFIQYNGINSFSLTGCEVTVISPTRNIFRGTFFLDTGENIKDFINEQDENIKTEITQAIVEILPSKISLEVSKQTEVIVDDVSQIKTEISALQIKSDQISSQVVTVNSTANSALSKANSAQTTANNAYNKANNAENAAASAEDIANEAKDLANNASSIGIYGQETYNQTSNPWNSWPGGSEYKHVGALWYNPSTDTTKVYVGTTGSNTWETVSTSNYATASYILQNSDKISAVVSNFDSNGKPTSSSGIITEAYGNTLWASSALEDGNELVSIINQTSTTIKLSAQKISLNGVVTANGTFSISTAGYITCTGGTIGGFTIKSNSISCDGRGSSLSIGVNGGRFFRVNANGSTGSMCAIRADSANALSLSTYGSSHNCIGLSIVCNAAGYGYAIKSYGNVLLEARNSETVTIKGLVLNMRTIGYGTTLNANDDCIRFTNTSTITVTMPAPVPGKVIFMFPMYSSSKVTLKPAGAIGFRSQDHQTYTTYTNNTVRPQIWICDGSYWDEFYCGN